MKCFPSERAGLAWFCVLALLSALVTVALIAKSGSAMPYADERDYFDQAQRLFAGQGYVLEDGTPTAYRPPGYPALLAPFTAWEHGVVAARMMNVAALLMALVLMRHLVWRHAPKWAWLAGGAALLYPVWMYAASTLYPQILCMVLLLALVCLITRDDLRWKHIGLAGVLLGGLILVAPSFQLIAPFFAFFILFAQRGSVRRRWWQTVALAATAVIVVAPWIWRNYQVFDTFVPVSTNGSVNLLLGNSEFTEPNSGIYVNVDKYLAVAEHLPELEKARALQRFAVEWISQHPGDAAWLYAKKVLNYFNYKADNVTTPGHLPSGKDLVMLLTYYPVLLVVVVRLMFHRRYPLSRVEWLMASIYFVNALLAAIFFTRLRFRLPFDGLLWVLMLTSMAAFLGQRGLLETAPGERQR
ncbi:hypothetical protein WNB94_05440 [Aquabacterium sp. A3]|uniref:hypothetical protein n=1 Tax=Aquabacterium sp. A3 TaxID=3132829 RepID=UPI00311A89F0